MKGIAWVMLFIMFFMCFVTIPTHEAEAIVMAAVPVAEIGVAMIAAGITFENEEAVTALATDFWNHASETVQRRFSQAHAALTGGMPGVIYAGLDLVNEIQDWFGFGQEDSVYSDGVTDVQVIQVGQAFSFDDWSDNGEYTISGTSNMVNYIGDIRGTYLPSNYGSVSFIADNLDIYKVGVTNTTSPSLQFRLYVDTPQGTRKYLTDWQASGQFLGRDIAVAIAHGVFYIYYSGEVAFESSTQGQYISRVSTNYSRGDILASTEDLASAYPGEDFSVDDTVWANMAMLSNSQIELQNQIEDLGLLVGATAGTLQDVLEQENDVVAPAVPSPIDPPVDGTETGWLSGVWSWLQSIWTSIQGLSNYVASISTAISTGLTGRVNDINVDKIQNLGVVATNKFPFSLPFDLRDSLQSLNFSGEMPSYELVLYNPLNESNVNFTVTIPEEFSFMIDFIRAVLLFLFSISLVFGTPKLLGGEV